MRVGVFGGSFNPPHIGHLIVAESARMTCRLDKVLWVPNNAPPHKVLASGATNSDRRRLVELAIGGNPAFELSDIELNRSGPSFTVDTLIELRAKYPDNEYWLIVGMDSLLSFGSWRQPDAIVTMARLAVYPRYGHDASTVEERFTPYVDNIDAPVVDVSSSLVRERAEQSQSIRYLLPESVHEYVTDQRLYLD